MLNHLKLCLAPLIALLAGCAAPPATTAAPAAPKAAVGARDAPKDQAAILEIAGSFDVEFNFEETTVLTAGYQKRPPSKTDATTSSLERAPVLATPRRRWSCFWNDVSTTSSFVPALPAPFRQPGS